MSARLNPRAVLAVFVAAALAPAASGANYVPEFVMGTTVPAYVTGVAVGDQVTLAMAGLSASKTATTATVSLSLAGVPAGLHEYTLSILSNGVTTSTSGFVLVETRMEDVYGSVLGHKEDDRAVQATENVTKELQAMEARVRANENATRLLLAQAWATENATKASLADLPGQVADGLAGGVNVTVDERADAQVLARMNQLQAGNEAVQESAAAAQQASNYGVYAVAALAVLALVFVWILLRQGRRARRETLVMLMLLATKAGITPGSPEFQHAMEAFDGKKPKKLKGKKALALEAKTN
ncbi:MAG: hypothetical protein QOD77_1540 [Thermoplasmata archaeon]|jgi:hypothetical protein|nr:hypothetical protein [Thermoplasmata archaeon]